MTSDFVKRILVEWDCKVGGLPVRYENTCGKIILCKFGVEKKESYVWKKSLSRRQSFWKV